MPVGLTAGLTRADIDSRSGKIAQQLNTTMEDVDDFKYFLDGFTDQQLIELGYNDEEVAVLRSSYGDLDQLRQIYQGLVGLAGTKDFRAFARRIWGTGFPA